MSHDVLASAFSPDGARLACITHDHRIRLTRTSVDTRTHTHAQAPTVLSEKAHLASGYTGALAWSGGTSSGAASSSPALLAVGTASGAVCVWDCDRGEVVARVGGAGAAGAGAEVNGAAASATPGGKKDKGGKPGSLRHTTPITAVAWSGPLLFAAAADSPRIHIWEMRAAEGAAAGSGASGMTAVAIGSITADKHGCTALALSADGSALFAAHTDVHVYARKDANTFTRIARLQGHAMPVTSLALSTDGLVLVSAGQERNVCVWDAGAAGEGTVAERWHSGAEADGEPRAPAAVLLHANIPGRLTILRAPKKAGTYHVATTSQDGSVCVWRYRRTDSGDNKGKDKDADARSRKPVAPGCRVAVTSGAAESASTAWAVTLLDIPPAESALVGAAPGESRTRCSLHVAAGSVSAPAFFAVPYLTSEGHLEQSIELTLPAIAPSKRDRAQAAAVQDSTSAAAEPNHAASAAAIPTRIGEHIAMPKVAVISGASIKHSETARLLNGHRAADPAAAGDAGDDDEEPSFAERMADLMASLSRGTKPVTAGPSARAAASAGVAAALATASGASQALVATPAASTDGSGASAVKDGAATVLSAAQAIATTGSLATVLTQALQSGDDVGVELVLGHSDKALIHATVSRLGPAAVLPLLVRIVAKLQARPSRGALLVPWLRALITLHTAYLLTIPDLVDKLSSLYALLDSRLAVYKKLLKLSGRLELLMAQSAAQPDAPGKVDARSRALKRARMVVAQADLEAGNVPAASAGDEVDAEDGISFDDLKRQAAGRKSRRPAEVAEDDDDDEKMESSEASGSSASEDGSDDDDDDASGSDDDDDADEDDKDADYEDEDEGSESD